MIYDEIGALVAYGLEKGLIEEADAVWARNRLLDILSLDAYEPAGEKAGETLEEILKAILDDAAARGVVDGGITSRDLLDTRLMGVLTPRPSQVIGRFRALYAEDPKAATDWYYALSCDSDYIRRYRIAKDRKWKAETEYGELDVTINLSKPEKDPRAIAAARSAKPSGYPKCQLCREAEGYAGRADYPARENHRLIPITLAGEDWFLQYSPYVYYNEHCIALCAEHRPMKIDRAAFRRLLDFVTLFPHYFIGSNADLPIVGGSILSHDHFQGGNYEFAMARAEVETKLSFPGFDDVRAGIVRWPMSVIRQRHPPHLRRPRTARGAGRPDPARLARLHGRERLDLCRDRRRGAQHHHADRPPPRRGVRAGSGAAQQSHDRGAPPGSVPPARRAASHQKGEHRPDRGDGSGRAARASERRAWRA